jgi:hypothetical protein
MQHSRIVISSRRIIRLKYLYEQMSGVEGQTNKKVFYDLNLTHKIVMI